MVEQKTPRYDPKSGQWEYESEFAKGFTDDPISSPTHYRKHPSGIECITITEHMNFCLGNAIKYIWRAGLKNDTIEDLKKAQWYIDQEISRLERMSK